MGIFKGQFGVSEENPRPPACNCAMLVVICFLLMVSPLTAEAGDFDGLRKVKAVWDVTTENGEAFESKLALIQHAADTLRKKGITPVFTIALDGHSVKFVTKALSGTRYAKENIENMSDIKEKIMQLHRSGVRFITCSISMEQGKVSRENILPFVGIVENVLANIVALQNKGYAYMPVH